MSLRNEQCNKVCRILDDVLASRPTERDFLITAVRKAFGALETEPKWIPCSERLPSPLEWDEKYLVSLAWGGIGVMEYKSTGFHNYGSFNPVPIETVTAWMPLPEPYREEGEK